MSKLFITGGAGFIGSNFIRYWLKKHPNDTVINFDKLTYAGNLSSLSDVARNKNYSFVQGDICDYQTVLKSIEGVDTVVHFAAESHVDRSVSNPIEFERTNVLGTMTLLNAVKELGIKRFHHVSTDEVFGSLELGGNEKFSEKTAYNPHSPYAASKAASDHFVRAYGDTYGIKYTISNCSNNYGPYHFPEKLLPLAITNLLEGKNIPIYGNGKQVRDWLFVLDHCTAIDAILEKGKIGETYCIGGLTEEVSNLDFIRLLLKIMNLGEDRIEFVKDRPGHDQKYSVDFTKIQKDLGWSPSVTLEEGMRHTLTWFKENQDWWRAIKDGSYKEYYQQQYN